MKNWGNLLLVFGILLGLFALSVDTSVSVDYPDGNPLGLPERVNNLGLMNEKQNYLIFSGILALIGIILIVSGGKTEPKKIDREKKELLYKRALDYYNKEDYSSAVTLLNQILVFDPTDEIVLFSLACNYSLQRNPEAFNTLEKAIKFGYNNFDKIKTYVAFSWLRSQPNYSSFIANNYKLPSPQVTENLLSTNDVISKLERLSKLKDQGIITEEEFLIQKKEILN